MENDIINSLTAEQAAVLPIRGNGNVIAGAGSGKTRTLTAKIVYDQKVLGIPSTSQIVVTFTNAGADEMRERLEAVNAGKPFHLGTLHSLAFRSIRKAWGGDVKVVSDEVFADLVKDLIRTTRVKVTTTEVIDAIIMGNARGRLGLLVKAIMAKMRSERAVHPDTMLPIFAELIPDLRLSGFKVYVDEAQDSAEIDFRIYDALSAGVGSLIMFGDPRQAIFAFRGADPALFAKRIGSMGMTNVVLTANFRSAKAIVTQANKIRMEFAVAGMVTPPDAPEGVVSMGGFFDTTESEIDHLRADVKAAIDDGRTVAVLARYNVTVDAAIAMMGTQFLVESPRRPEDLEASVIALSNITTVPTSWTDTMSALGVSFQLQDKLLPVLERIRQPEEIRDAVMEGIGRPTGKGTVWVSTVHGSKGLEWDVVFLIGADNQCFDANDPEEARLAYVAVTRAKHSFYATFARSRPGGMAGRVNDLAFTRILS